MGSGGAQRSSRRDATTQTLGDPPNRGIRMASQLALTRGAFPCRPGGGKPRSHTSEFVYTSRRGHREVVLLAARARPHEGRVCRRARYFGSGVERGRVVGWSPSRGRMTNSCDPRHRHGLGPGGDLVDPGKILPFVGLAELEETSPPVPSRRDIRGDVRVERHLTRPGLLAALECRPWRAWQLGSRPGPCPGREGRRRSRTPPVDASTAGPRGGRPHPCRSGAEAPRAQDGADPGPGGIPKRWSLNRSPGHPLGTCLRPVARSEVRGRQR